MAATAEREKLAGQSILAPFTIEVDHPRNCDLLLQSIPGCRLRSTIRGDRYITDAKNGEKRIPADQARHLGQLPTIPGMQLTVNPEEMTYKIVDPLSTDKDFCKKLQKSLGHTQGFKIDGELRGVPDKKGKLDVHRMKNLCREVIWLLEAGDVKVIKGSEPTMDRVDALPGKFLLNPGAQVPNTQPVYEEDYDDWVAQLARAGG
jgi:hypothetical protein